MNLRFSRQIRLPEVGDVGQELIQNAKVLIVGMGGLGCPAAQYLIAAGVGLIGLVDGDRVEESNLHRQILYSQQDIHKPKVTAAAERLQELNSTTVIKCYFEHLNSVNVKDIFADYNIILDGTDNFEAKYLLNDMCLQMDKILVSASVTGFEANLLIVTKNGPCLRCLYPQANMADIGNCNRTGVLGAFVGIVGSWQAAEILKLILTQNNSAKKLFAVIEKVLFFDFYESQIRSVKLAKNSSCICSKNKMDLEHFKSDSIYITMDQVRSLEDSIFIDVRPEEELEAGPIPGIEMYKSFHRPYQQIMSNEFDKDNWNSDGNYILCCSQGRRSAVVAQWLRDHGVQKSYSLRRS
ncbi:MAG: HesA/MoeB/ThiF family protein [Pseudobdellovibrio sp.]